MQRGTDCRPQREQAPCCASAWGLYHSICSLNCYYGLSRHVSVKLCLGFGEDITQANAFHLGDDLREDDLGV